MTEPRTEAGRKFRDYLRDSFVHEADDTEPLDMSDRILTIEREAALLDVDRLADFIRDKIESEPYQGLHPELASMGLAIAIRDEFAVRQIAETSPAPQGAHSPATPDDPADGGVGGGFCPDCEHPQRLHTTGGICHGSPDGCYCVRIPPMEYE